MRPDNEWAFIGRVALAWLLLIALVLFATAAFPFVPHRRAPAQPVVREGDYRVHLNARFLMTARSDGATLRVPVRAFANALGFVTHYEKRKVYIAGREVEDASTRGGDAFADAEVLARGAKLKLRVIEPGLAVFSRRSKE